jgi:hypothetical protein
MASAYSSVGLATPIAQLPTASQAVAITPEL